MNSIAEIQAYTRKQADSTPRDRLIFLPNVYSTRLVDHRYPTPRELDEAAPDHPAMDNGYSAVRNLAALRQIGVTRDTVSPLERQDHQ